MQCLLLALTMRGVPKQLMRTCELRVVAHRLASGRVPVGNVRLPGRGTLLAACPDEVAGTKFAGVAPWPGTAPGDVHVAEHDGVGTVGVLGACRRVLDL